MWRGLIEAYRDRLPVTDATPVVTLHEGNTPLLPAPVLSARPGCDVYLKVEGANPTGSFKDRGMTVAVSKAVEAGNKAIICASTGNTSASAAAYAARAGHHLRGARAAGQDRAGQAGPGAGARREAAAGQRQLRRLPGAGRPSSPRTTRSRWSTRSTSTGCTARRPPPSRSSRRSATRPDIHCLPVGNAGNITAYWMGYQEDLAAGNATRRPEDVRLPGRRRRADRRPARWCGSRRPSPPRSGSATRRAGPRRSTRGTPPAA